MPTVLGVDPGSYTTGWSVLDGTAGEPVLLGSGEIRLPQRLSFPERLHALQVEILEVVGRFRPDSAAVESPFHGPSARAALQLAHARGVILAVLAGNGIPVSEYPPATVKKAVTGTGRAGKEQVQAMVERLLRSPLDPSAGTDLSDAVAVAVCHLAHEGHRRAVARALGRSSNRN